MSLCTSTPASPEGTTLEVICKEDVAAELEDFVFLARLGVIDEALDLVDNILWRHIHIFPVMAEVAGYLLELNDRDRLRALVNKARKHGIAFPDERDERLWLLISQLAHEGGEHLVHWESQTPKALSDKSASEVSASP